MCQHDFDGRRIFQHRNSDKWDLFLRNRYIKDFWLDRECREFVRRLQRLWDGRMGSLGLDWKIPAGRLPRNKTPKLQAVMISSGHRHDLRRQTLENLTRTDWGEVPVHVQIANPANGVDDPQWQMESALLVLKACLDREADYILFLEDDLDFNRHLRHNLINWLPFKTATLAAASLYNPSVRELACDLKGNTRVMDPNSVFASQALLLSKPAVKHIVRHWDKVEGRHDFKMSRLAGELAKRFFYHAPSLVQHLDPVKELGGIYDRAMDFDPVWRAKPAPTE